MRVLWGGALAWLHAQEPKVGTTARRQQQQAWNCRMPGGEGSYVTPHTQTLHCCCLLLRPVLPHPPAHPHTRAQVQKVTDAVKLVKEARPDLMVEGPLQYDAAIDPAVAAVKIKTPSEVAGRATVFIFPDLNTGNNTYKAVQQVWVCGGVKWEEGVLCRPRGGEDGGAAALCAGVVLQGAIATSQADKRSVMND